MKILAIDDNHGMLFVIRKALEIKNYHVETSDHYYGIESVKEISPDLIFLDVSLEAENGCEISREIKSDKLTAGIPIIILTGYSNGDELFKEALAQGYLAKPFGLVNLWEIVAKHIKTTLPIQ